jgi:flagellar biosynthesis regulator FlbT
MEVKLKLIGSTSPDIFEQRLNDFLASLDKDDIVVDVKFATSPVGNQVEYNALVQYQTTDSWDD